MAGSVGMLVYIDFASQVKRRAPRGRVSGVRSCLKAKESRKYDGWDEAMGCSMLSIHFPRPWGRLLTSEHTGRVGQCPFFIPLWILYVA